MSKNLAAKILVFFILFFTSCNRSSNVLHILTDKTELAVAAQIYGSLNNDVRMTLQHVPAINADTVRDVKPDLIIGEDINSSAILSLLAPLEASPPVYPALTGPKNDTGETVILPLAFNLPLIMGRKEVMDELPDPVIIRSSDIRALETSFIRQDKFGRLTRLGFSPSWNPASYIDLLWLKFRLSGKSFESVNDVDMIFNGVRDDLIAWIVASAGSLDSDIVFNRRYRYLPNEMLLDENRIRFARIDFHSWAAMPSISAKKLDIRYFSGDRSIPVSSVTWGGRLKGSLSAEHAEKFLNWLLSPAAQEQLIARWETEGLSVFGFLGGLSSIPEVNQKVITARFPSLLGMLPEDHYLAVQRLLPDRWARIQNEVISPWFTSAIYSPDSSETLSAAYSKWDLSSLDQSD